MRYADMVERAGAAAARRSTRWPASRSRPSPRSPATRSAAAASWRSPPTSGSRPTTPSSASRRSCSASSPAPAARSGCPGWSARQGEGPDLHRTVRRRRGGARDRPGGRGGRPPTTCTPRRSRWRAQFANGPALALRRGQGGHRRRPGRRPAPPGCGWRPQLFAGAVRHRGPRDRDDVVHRERPRQGAVHRPMSVTRRGADPSRRCSAPARRSRRPGTTPSSPTSSTTTGKPARTTRSGRSRTTSAASTTPGTGSRYVAGPAGWPYAAALEIGCGTGFFLLNLMQAGVVDRGSRDRPQPGHGGGGAAQRRVASASTSTGGWPTPRRSRTRTTTFDLVVGHAVLHHIPDVELALARGAAGAQAGRPVRLRRRADPVRRLRRAPAVPVHLVDRDPT